MQMCGDIEALLEHFLGTINKRVKKSYALVPDFLLPREVYDMRPLLAHTSVHEEVLDVYRSPTADEDAL